MISPRETAMARARNWNTEAPGIVIQDTAGYCGDGGAPRPQPSATMISAPTTPACSYSESNTSLAAGHGWVVASTIERAELGGDVWDLCIICYAFPPDKLERIANAF